MYIIYCQDNNYRYVIHRSVKSLKFILEIPKLEQSSYAKFLSSNKNHCKFCHVFLERFLIYKL